MCGLCHGQVLQGLYRCVHENAAENYLAFYSSRLGGITTDPALMVVPMDDHLVHRGHAVFDTATMTQVIHTVPAQTPRGVAAVEGGSCCPQGSLCTFRTRTSSISVVHEALCTGLIQGPALHQYARITWCCAGLFVPVG